MTIVGQPQRASKNRIITLSRTELDAATPQVAPQVERLLAVLQDVTTPIPAQETTQETAQEVAGEVRVRTPVETSKASVETIRSAGRKVRTPVEMSVKTPDGGGREILE